MRAGGKNFQAAHTSLSSKPVLRRFQITSRWIVNSTQKNFRNGAFPANAFRGAASELNHGPVEGEAEPQRFVRSIFGSHVSSTSASLPMTLRVLYTRQCGPSCRKGRIPRLCRLDCGSFPAGECFRERFLLSRSATSRFEVNFPVAENVVCPGSFAGGLSLPRLVAPNSQRASVRRLRSPFRTEESLGHFHQPLQLRRAERKSTLSG